jgi:hypothetical protein
MVTLLTLFSSLPQKVADFSTISKANNGQLLWQRAYIIVSLYAKKRQIKICLSNSW